MSEDKRFVFEAVKMQMNQTKDGWALALRLHPEDLSLELMQLPVGQRLGVALIPIDDDDGAYRNREMMSRVVREEKEEAAHKRKYNVLKGSILGSPYLHMWAEERGFVAGAENEVIESLCVADTWKERAEKLQKIAQEVASYVG